MRNVFLNEDGGVVSDHAPSLRTSRTVWVSAAFGALAIHVGGVALALGYLQPDDSDPDLGAPAIEIGVELMAPHRDSPDLAVGPDTEAAAPAQTNVAQKQVIEQTDLPKAVPSETEDPDRVVSPAESRKSKTDDPKIAPNRVNPSESSVPTDAKATPSVENAPESSRSVTPSLGTGNSTVRERVTWEKELAAHFDKYKRYPSNRVAQAATVTVSFVLDRTGHVLATGIVKGSGDASFDEAALAMLRRASPVPSPPPLVADKGLAFTLPVIFHVKH